MKKKFIGCLLTVSLVLAGCSIGTSIEKQLSDVMNTMNKSEKEYITAQEKLTELEKSEQQLFVATMELTQEQKEELQTKVAALKESLEKRKESIKDEEVAIKTAEESMLELDEVIESADADEKKEIQRLKASISERYDHHVTFVAEYKNLVSLQEELYAMLIAEDTELTMLKTKVDEVNAQNEMVKSAISDFNSATGKVNEVKDNVFKSLKEE